ncbi:MAG TPA: alpha/beta fold hydrolase [Myxococcota bacterium]|jgi:carboxylesterase|nr:alpha/beta fold hydrolase [Myxococcota bacterium]
MDGPLPDTTAAPPPNVAPPPRAAPATPGDVAHRATATATATVTATGDGEGDADRDGSEGDAERDGSEGDADRDGSGRDAERDGSGGDAALRGDPSPFFLRAGPRGVLLVHGFNGTPHTMRYLGEHLHRRGFTVLCDVLPGHDAGPAALGDVAWPRWYGQLEAGLRTLRAHCQVVGLAGLSMGAALGVRLLRQYGPANVRCAALLAPALLLPRGTEAGLGLMHRLGLDRLFPTVPRPRGGDIADPAARAANPTGTRTSTRAATQLVDLLAAARRDLEVLQQPLLVVHSRRDHTVPFRSAQWIARHAAAPVRLVELHRSYHLITVDRDRARVAQEVAAFFDENL